MHAIQPPAQQREPEARALSLSLARAHGTNYLRACSSRFMALGRPAIWPKITKSITSKPYRAATRALYYQPSAGEQ